LNFNILVSALLLRKASGARGNGNEANGGNTEETGDAELRESQCSCAVSPLRWDGALRPSRVALLPVLAIALFLLDLSFAHCFTSCFQIIRFEIISILGFLREFDLNWYVADYWVINHRSRNKVSKGMPWFATKRLLASNVSLLIHYRSAGLSTLADWFLSFTWHGCFIWVLYVAHERLMSMILTDLHCAKILKFIIRHVSIMALIPVIHILSTL
jgi:hypothetical protein